ncbi:MAG TPA: 3-hydroxyacyl-[acyl-carrier-protein] dehydratase FabZ, partial [Clostridiales bacterium]|nr:3-hydroxyacyl-[acyl-carrier-protein] dehydratase FabZ [Clostridiales bacterium]
EKAKFRKKVKPGDLLDMKVEITRLLGPAGKGNGTAYVDGEVACTVTATFFMGE